MNRPVDSPPRMRTGGPACLYRHVARVVLTALFLTGWLKRSWISTEAQEEHT